MIGLGNISGNLIFGILWLCFLLVQGCQTDPCGSAPADLIDNMEDLIKEVSKVDYEVKSDQWKKYDDRFKVYYEDCYEGWVADMTFAQKREFAGLVTRYVASRFGRSFFRSIFGNDKRDGEIDQESLDNLSKNLQKFMEENQKWAEELLKDLMKDANSD